MKWRRASNGALSVLRKSIASYAITWLGSCLRSRDEPIEWEALIYAKDEDSKMAGSILKFAAALVVLLAPFGACAAIGDFTGTSSPTVIVPQTTPAPQTPAYPTPPIGTYGAGVFVPQAPRTLRNHTVAPRVVAPAYH
jgi:hypothetical protein